jgi:hypothetical protein
MTDSKTEEQCRKYEDKYINKKKSESQLKSQDDEAK